MLLEMLGSGPVHCEFELRDEALWTRTRDSEIPLPWARLTRVHDAGDAIEMWFDPGLAVVRDRAFASADDRRRFLEAVMSKSSSSGVEQTPDR